MAYTPAPGGTVPLDFPFKDGVLTNAIGTYTVPNGATVPLPFGAQVADAHTMYFIVDTAFG